MHNILQDFNISNILCRALNEGITEWITQKTTPRTSQSNYFYKMEVNIVRQIENIVGTKKLIEIVNKKPEEMNKLLNMNIKEFVNFSNQMDYALFIDDLIIGTIIKNKQFDKFKQFHQEEGKYLNSELKSTTLDIQNQLVKKIIIPYFKKNEQNNSENFEKALKCIGLIKDYLEGNSFKEFINTNEYKELKKELDKIIIQYTMHNSHNIDGWDKKRVFRTYNILSLYEEKGFNDYYDRFIDQLDRRIKEIRLKEDAIVIDTVKKKLNNSDKIDISLFITNYFNLYTSYNINTKVQELILNRKLTDKQKENLLKEIKIYVDCGKVISKKDIKKEKNKNGHVEYYVIVNNEKYTNEHLKKLKFDKKFLSSKKYEVINNEKENKKYQIKENTALSVLDEKKQGKIAKFITFLKEKFLNKKNKKDKIYKTVTDKTNITDSPVDDFRESLRVKSSKTISQVKQDRDNKVIEKDER